MGIKGTTGMIAIAAALALAGCATTDDGGSTGPHAVADLNPTQGSNVRGKVHFYQTGNGVRVVADISGLTPGRHGFHVHEKGDCSAPDGASAGAHFNPTGMKHGAPESAERHAGDFGNITADESGKAHYERVDKNISFEGANSVLGRGVIVHAKADDLMTQPAGDAGARLACGVIIRVK